MEPLSPVDFVRKDNHDDNDDDSAVFAQEEGSWVMNSGLLRESRAPSLRFFCTRIHRLFKCILNLVAESQGGSIMAVQSLQT